MADREFPDHDALFQHSGAAKGTTWGPWGADDELGTRNVLTPERVVRAAALVRTGKRFNLDYLALSTDERIVLNKRRSTPGLAQTEPVVRWLWNHRIALVAADNTGVERSLAQQSDLFDPAQPPPERGPDHNGMIHRPLIALLGTALGGLWALGERAADCAEDHRYEFLLVASPLNLIGGAGSPRNAIAIA